MKRAQLVMQVLACVALVSVSGCKEKVEVPAAPRVLADVVTAPRPEGTEYFGVYLLDATGKQSKIGYMTTTMGLSDDQSKFTVTQSTRLIAKVSSANTDREVTETRVYDSKPGGRLLSFKLVQKGDGGDQTIEATGDGTGLRVLRKRPGTPNETFTVKEPKETIDDADQARLAIKRGGTLNGMLVDPMDLKQYRVETVHVGVETRLVRGVSMKVHHTTTMSEKVKVPTDIWYDEDGRMLEVHYGPTLLAVAEPADVAKKVTAVEVFGFTRVMLPNPAPATYRQVPGSLTLVMQGIPDRFRLNTYRQHYRALDRDRVELKISAAVPTKTVDLPVTDPSGGKNLESTLAVESDNPEIKAQAKELVGAQKNAYAIAKTINRWVYDNVKSLYGASSDSAVHVMQSLKGDCTEHALLAVALLRAAGIPARRIDGVVYLMNEDKVPALYWHEWTEVFVGEWVQMDPTFNQEVADSGHLALGEEAGAEITPLIGSIKVEEVR